MGSSIMHLRQPVKQKRYSHLLILHQLVGDRMNGQIMLWDPLEKAVLGGASFTSI
jgi:hypothetical protein